MSMCDFAYIIVHHVSPLQMQVSYSRYKSALTDVRNYITHIIVSRDIIYVSILTRISLNIQEI